MNQVNPHPRVALILTNYVDSMLADAHKLIQLEKHWFYKHLPVRWKTHKLRVLKTHTGICNNLASVAQDHQSFGELAFYNVLSEVRANWSKQYGSTWYPLSPPDIVGGTSYDWYHHGKTTDTLWAGHQLNQRIYLLNHVREQLIQMSNNPHLCTSRSQYQEPENPTREAARHEMGYA